MAAAVALACLPGLAACGGGGGGGGGPVTPQPPYHFEKTAWVVTELNTTIGLHTHGPLSDAITFNRTPGGVIYEAITVGDGAPKINKLNSSGGVIDSLAPEPLAGNVWLFTDTYTQGGEDYRGIAVLSYDSALTTGNDRHVWGVWLRQHTDSKIWDGVGAFNYRDVTTESALDIDEQNVLTGTATFTGGALGAYTKGSAAGWFSAKASVTAHFGGDQVAEANQFTMTGTINNFVLSGQEDTDWRVTLSGEPPKDGAGTPEEVFWTGTAVGEGAQTGAFRARFDHPRDGQAVIRVRGTFHARFSDGAAIGAFNATP